MRFGRLAFALVLAAAPSALAQTVSDQPAEAPAVQAPAAQLPPQDPAQRFQAYVTNDGYKGMLAQLANMGESISAPECKTPKPLERASLTVYGTPLFEAALHPVSGLWVDRIKMDRCGTITFQNVLLQAQTDGKPPRAALLMPGTTMTNPPMQKIVMKDIVDGLAKKKCTDQTQIVPINSKMDKETKPMKLDPKGTIAEGVWKESWTFKACGKMVTATVDFAADGKGSLSHKVKL